MRARCTRWLAATMVVALVGAVAATTAGASAPRQRPSDRYCAALQQQYSVSILLSFITAFTSLGNDLTDDTTDGTTETTDGRTDGTTETTTETTTGEDVDPDEIRGTFLLILSPLLEGVAGELAKEGPRRLREAFEEQEEIFAEGVDILRDEVGLTDDQVDALREFDLSADADSATELETVFEDNDIDQETIAGLGKDFAAEFEEVSDAGPGVDRELDRRARRCGIVPDSTVDCAELVTAEEATDALGVDATLDDEETCSYLGPDPDFGLQPELAVEVYATDRAYDRLTARSDDSEPVDDVGEQAVSIEGFSAQGGIKTCGRTLIAQGEDHTVIVALCPFDDEPVDDATLADLGSQVLERVA